MLIINPGRKKQIAEFIDNDRRVMHEYYDLMECSIPGKRLMKEMLRLIKEDEDFYDPYLVAADILFSSGKNGEAEEMLKRAYERAVIRIVDSKGQWPKEMVWGFLENRHLMRAIERYAILCWEDGRTDEALDIFRRLLRSNPNDNQGVRYNILAIRMGVGVEEWQKPFEAKRNGKIVGLDAIKVQEWFERNAEKYPDDFEWLLKLWKKWGEK